MKRSVAAAAVLALGLGLLGAPPAGAATAARPYDFDGNRHPDLTVGAPGLRIGNVRGAGGVVVLSASATGLSLAEKIVSQSSRGVPGASETGDLFGATVASADFDVDGYADLAVGQPGEASGAADAAGAVTVVYGSARGLDTTRAARFLSPAGATSSGRFGTALVAGDFTGDDRPDLAVGAPGEDVDQSQDEDFHPAGTVTVLRGGAAGLTATGAVVLRRQGLPDFDVQFGAALAAGDLDEDGDDALVVGSEGQGRGDDRFPGSVSYCAAPVAAPAGCTRLVKDLTFAGLRSLAVGDTSSTGRPEVVAGVPDSVEDDAGHVQVLQLRGRSTLAVARRTSLAQSSAGVPGSDQPGDGFGASVALGDLDRDGYDDLVVGAPGEDEGAGRVTVVHGADGGWRASGNYFYDQDSRGVPGGREEGDRFGASVTLLDHDRDQRLDLTVGAPGENADAGAITTLRGSGTRFTTAGARTFGLATLGYAHPGGALFGSALGR